MKRKILLSGLSLILTIIQGCTTIEENLIGRSKIPQAADIAMNSDGSNIIVTYIDKNHKKQHTILEFNEFGSVNYKDIALPLHTYYLNFGIQKDTLLAANGFVGGEVEVFRLNTKTNSKEIVLITKDVPLFLEELSNGSIIYFESPTANRKIGFWKKADSSKIDYLNNQSYPVGFPWISRNGDAIFVLDPFQIDHRSPRLHIPVLGKIPNFASDLQNRNSKYILCNGERDLTCTYFDERKKIMHIARNGLECEIPHRWSQVSAFRISNNGNVVAFIGDSENQTFNTQADDPFARTMEQRPLVRVEIANNKCEYKLYGL